MILIRKNTGQVQSFDPNIIRDSLNKINTEIPPTKSNRLINLVVESIQDKEIVDVKELKNIIWTCLKEVDYDLADSYYNFMLV